MNSRICIAYNISNQLCVICEFWLRIEYQRGLCGEWPDLSNAHYNRKDARLRLLFFAHRVYFCCAASCSAVNSIQVEVSPVAMSALTKHNRACGSLATWPDRNHVPLCCTVWQYVRSRTQHADSDSKSIAKHLLLWIPLCVRLCVCMSVFPLRILNRFWSRALRGCANAQRPQRCARARGCHRGMRQSSPIQRRTITRARAHRSFRFHHSVFIN